MSTLLGRQGKGTAAMKSFILVLAALLVALSGCIPTPTPAPPTAAPTTAPTVAPPTATAAATQAPTVTLPPEPTATSMPTEQPTATAAAQTPPVITRENLPGLAMQSFGVPEYVERFIWPAADAPLPGDPSPRPDLLLQSGANLHPILLDPMGLGAPLPLPLNGTEIVSFAPDATSMVIRDPSRTAVYRLDGTLLRELPRPANVYGAGYSSDSRFLVVASADIWEANVYDLSAGPDAPPVTLTGFETAAPVYGVQIAPGGQTIAWYARATLQLQDVATGAMGAKFSFEDFISNFAFSPDGSRLVLLVGETISLYELPEGRQLGKIPLSGPLYSLNWSPDGLLIASGYERSLSIWDGRTLEPLMSLPGPNNATLLAAFSPDGRYIVTTHEDNQFSVWKIQ